MNPRVKVLGLRIGSLVLAAFLAGSGTFLQAQKLRTKKLAEYSIDSLKTFDFRPSSRRGSNLLRRFPEARQWIEESFEQALAGYGLQRSTGAEPDFYVVLWAESREKSRKLDSSRVSLSYVEQFLEAELVVEMVRSAEDAPFWRGTATDRVDFTEEGPKITWEKAEKKVRKVCARLARRFLR